ncbi:MAG: hypothetical protein HYZ11_08060 [Candidatus Tectomicrobia bacterium]|uniref:Uncharacterized protein n=1 Tax=Tectimicrobiota bacterium TaxID=2528274 RepID=A0A932MPW8_UNCTE|nr:hypothetical protein [Candidatus Tectomicrobia bacterium]
MDERPLRSLGKSYPREVGPDMVAGLTQFVEDIRRLSGDFIGIHLGDAEWR